MAKFRPQEEYEKEFLKIIDQMCYSRQKWQVWQDIINAIACSISNATEKKGSDRWLQREKSFKASVDQLGGKRGMELAAKAFSIITVALEQNPNQDFLGSLYMRLELGSHWHGQFFTPYSVCQMSSQITLGGKADVQRHLDQHGYLSACDPAVGGGAMLIALANGLKEMGINYQQNCMFVGQDIDIVAGQMAYIQMSLLGMPGYICIASTISDPITGPVLIPNEQKGQQFWYTPFYYHNVWNMRRIRMLIGGMGKSRTNETKPKHFIIFDFDKQEAINERIYEQPCN